MPQISAVESKWNESTVDFVGDLFLLEPLLGRNSTTVYMARHVVSKLTIFAPICGNLH